MIWGTGTGTRMGTGTGMGRGQRMINSVLYKLIFRIQNNKFWSPYLRQHITPSWKWIGKYVIYKTNYFNVYNFSLCHPHCFNLLSCMDEYLAIGSGGHLCMNGLSTVIAACVRFFSSNF